MESKSCKHYPQLTLSLSPQVTDIEMRDGEITRGKLIVEGWRRMDDVMPNTMGHARKKVATALGIPNEEKGSFADNANLQS